MEKQLLQKMRDNFGYFGGMSLLYGLVFAACLYKNMMGAAVVLCVIVTIAFSILFLRKIGLKLKAHTLQYLVGMLLLGIANCMTGSEFFIFFNWIGIILLYAVAMLHQFYEDEKWDFPAYMFRLMMLFGTTVVSVGYPVMHGAAYAALQKGDKKKTVMAVVAGLLLALGFLAIVLPLLIQSDMIFASFFSKFFVELPLSTLIGILCTMLLGTILCYSFFGALCRQNCPQEKARNQNTGNPVIGITFAAVLAGVYILYCGIQVLYLFLGMDKGLPVEFTYSAYARSGFWQLLAVSFINFVVVLVCMNRFREHNVLKGLLTVLSVCTFIMTASAAYRMLLYVAEYRLTFLRVLVLWFLAVLACIMAGVVISIYRKKFRLFPYIVMVVASGYILLSFAKPEYLIAKYNLSMPGQILASDVRYLLHASIDATPAIADIDMEKVIEDSEYGVLEEEINLYMQNISWVTKNMNLRNANYSKQQAKRAADRYLQEASD